MKWETKNKLSIIKYLLLFFVGSYIATFLGLVFSQMFYTFNPYTGKSGLDHTIYLFSLLGSFGFIGVVFLIGKMASQK